MISLALLSVQNFFFFFMPLFLIIHSSIFLVCVRSNLKDENAQKYQIGAWNFCHADVNGVLILSSKAVAVGSWPHNVSALGGMPFFSQCYILPERRVLTNVRTFVRCYRRWTRGRGTPCVASIRWYKSGRRCPHWSRYNYYCPRTHVTLVVVVVTCSLV